MRSLKKLYQIEISVNSILPALQARAYEVMGKNLDFLGITIPDNIKNLLCYFYDLKMYERLRKLDKKLFFVKVK